MNIIRRDPFNTLTQLHDEFQTLFGKQLNPFSTTDESSVLTSDWHPAVDIKEDKNKFVVLADIPGVDPKDIDITMENGILTIKGERKTESKEEKENFKRVERTYGSFYRRFSLPDTANADSISAVSKDGVLEITLNKKETEKPRKIPVAH
ncbi:MAG: Hsp20/alpha crystallin family protein [Gammaproteobacteria bacterium]|nr:Hsp20/alpha crystallin family protein [Gammaproteobacteria bacterium]